MIYFEIIENKNSETVYYIVRRSFGFLEYIIKWIVKCGVEQWIGPRGGDSLWMYEIHARRFLTLEEAINSANYHANIILSTYKINSSSTKKKVIQKNSFWCSYNKQLSKL